MLPADLRDVKGVEAALLAAGFNPQLPTYVLAECVLVYMEAEESASVVRWLGSFLSTAACIVFEQVQSSTPVDSSWPHIYRTNGSASQPSPEDSSRIVTLKLTQIVCCGQIKPGDAFGRQMLTNLEVTCVLPEAS